MRSGTDIEAIKERLAAVDAIPEGYMDDAAFDAVLAMQEHHEQDLRALVAEVERLEEALTLTPERVEAACTEHWGEKWEHMHPALQDAWRSDMRAGLLAAGMTEEAE